MTDASTPSAVDAAITDLAAAIDDGGSSEERGPESKKERHARQKAEAILVAEQLQQQLARTAQLQGELEVMKSTQIRMEAERVRMDAEARALEDRHGPATSSGAGGATAATSGGPTGSIGTAGEAASAGPTGSIGTTGADAGRPAIGFMVGAGTAASPLQIDIAVHPMEVTQPRPAAWAPVPEVEPKYCRVVSTLPVSYLGRIPAGTAAAERATNERLAGRVATAEEDTPAYNPAFKQEMRPVAKYTGAGGNEALGRFFRQMEELIMQVGAKRYVDQLHYARLNWTEVVDDWHSAERTDRIRRKAIDPRVGLLDNWTSLGAALLRQYGSSSQEEDDLHEYNTGTTMQYRSGESIEDYFTRVTALWNKLSLNAAVTNLNFKERILSQMRATHTLAYNHVRQTEEAYANVHGQQRQVPSLHTLKDEMAQFEKKWAHWRPQAQPQQQQQHQHQRSAPASADGEVAKLKVALAAANKALQQKASGGGQGQKRTHGVAAMEAEPSGKRFRYDTALIDRLRQENRCFNCGEAGHKRQDCVNDMRDLAAADGLGASKMDDGERPARRERPRREVKAMRFRKQRGGKTGGSQPAPQPSN